jgi:hypothetical protein
MNACLFWGKFLFENCTLLQNTALSAGKRALSAGRFRLVRTPAPTDPPMFISNWLYAMVQGQTILKCFGGLIG